MIVRKPAFSGAFYPADASSLSKQIEKYLEAAGSSAFESAPRILIVPHAGYSFSGPVVASGFKELRGFQYTRAVLLGVSHQAYFEGIVIDGSDLWETPLGRTELDKEFIGKLLSVGGSNFTINSKIHAVEHSLEVELPFLQMSLGDFKIIPILLGSKSEEIAASLISALAKLIDPQTILIVSTDLSHYPPYDDARKIDQRTIAAILDGDTAELTRVISESMSEGVSNLVTCICGESAVRVAMKLAFKIKAPTSRLLKYANSGDTAGDKSQVVGYAAIGFFGKQSSEHIRSEGAELSEKRGQKLLKISRQTLELFVREGRLPKVEISDPILNESYGAFVTLKEGDRLRGCLGVLETSEPLWKVVQDQTIAAASQDPRFPPVLPGELSTIEIEISVLSKPKRIASPSEIELGKHGVIVRRGDKGGVFLPQVALETGWDLKTFMGQLCLQKAGLPEDAWKDPQTKLYIFTAKVFREKSG